MSILKIEKLSHKYSTSWAVRDINLDINRKGVIGLLGSNGAGKSTTMNIICGVLNQTEGNVYINGIDTRKNPQEAKKNIGFLPQNPPVYTDLTVDEYLTYCAELRLIDDSKVKAAVTEAKEKCQITHFSNRLIGNLSGGYRQRVGIAQAIIHKPKLVILDEPTNGLDPNQLIEARNLIREISNSCTVMLSSHIMNEIHLLCSEIVMIDSGQIIFSDTMEAFNNYSQSNRVLVQMENPPSLSELQTIEGVVRIETVSTKQFRMYFEGDRTITEKIIAASTKNDWRLQEISIEKNQLDDVFKNLSSQFNQ